MTSSIRIRALVGAVLVALVLAPVAAWAAIAPPSPTSLTVPPLLQGSDAGDRVRGTVASVVGDQVTLDDGTSFLLAADTSIIVSVPGTAADLQPGGPADVREGASISAVVVGGVAQTISVQ